MGYKKIAKREEKKLKRCVECKKCFIAELSDDMDTCPHCIENLLQPVVPLPWEAEG